MADGSQNGLSGDQTDQITQDDSGNTIDQFGNVFDPTGQYIGNVDGTQSDPGTVPTPTQQTIGAPDQMITPYGTTLNANQTTAYNPVAITYSDGSGNVYDANGVLIASTTPTYSTAASSPNLGPNWTDNGDGTYTNNITGQTIQGANSAATNDQLLQQAGANPVGGSLGSATGGTANQLGNSTVQSILGTLAKLAQQALNTNNNAQIAAIQAAQLRFGGIPTPMPSNFSSTALLALLAVGAILLGKASSRSSS